ncbi:response regulator [Pseudoclavibacter sp. RFBG4]|uniref:response regulator n=1 Tax=Pseudoclavibacter sp. RFBG4 TaxID=2080575 RepID=UPI000CE77A22|nr:response regulator [Pseudoclavibacter sp. RFBG4]PPG35688.1 response regulator [Pseudoclavibacter sp. RFBG4]
MSADQLRVLIVDDNADQRELLRTQFRKAGCAAKSAATLDEALASIRVEVPDVAVIDLLLGVGSGWEVREKICELVPEVAIVISSVLDESDYPSSDDVLPKPFTGKQVKGLVARLRARRA